MFQRINFKLNNIDFDRLKGDLVTSYGRPPRPTITYWRLGDRDYFESILPNEMFYGIPPYQVQIAEIFGSGHLLPHIDHNVSACANYYIDTNGSTTYFYKKRPYAPGFKYPGREIANIFPLNQVIKVDEFVAEQNDLYLLDVSQVHSVFSPNPGIRRFISWQWVDVPFEDVKNTLLENLK